MWQFGHSKYRRVVDMACDHARTPGTAGAKLRGALRNPATNLGSISEIRNSPSVLSGIPDYTCADDLALRSVDSRFLRMRRSSIKFNAVIEQSTDANKIITIVSIRLL